MKKPENTDQWKKEKKSQETTLLAMIVHSAVQSHTRTLYPYAILFIDIPSYTWYAWYNKVHSLIEMTYLAIIALKSFDGFVYLWSQAIQFMNG